MMKKLIILLLFNLPFSSFGQYRSEKSPFAVSGDAVSLKSSYNNIGIGIIPTQRLQIKSAGGDTYPIDVIRSNASTTNDFIFRIQQGGAGHGIILMKNGSGSQTIQIHAGSTTYFNAGAPVGIGSTASPTANGGKVLFFGDNINDPTMAAGTAGLYAKTVSGIVEMFAIGSDGLMNQISSHNPKTRELYHYSIDAKTGKHIQIDVERLAKWIDKHFGTNFVKEWYEPKPLFNELKPRDSFLRTEQ